MLLCNMNTNMKKISKQSQLYIKLNIFNVFIIKLLFKSYNSVLTKFSTIVGIAVVCFVPHTATGTYFDLIDVSNIIKQGPILQEEKDKYNSLSLCCYCNKPEYIAINHRNSILLAIKKQAAATFIDNLIALVPYKPFFIKEKRRF